MITLLSASKTYAIISFGDLDAEHRAIPAATIFDELFRLKQWHITRVSHALSVGTTALFYQNGVGVRGSAIIRDIVKEQSSTLFCKRVPLLFMARLDLDAIVVFRAPIRLGPIVQDLEFISNKKYWGHALRGTPRQISQRDYNIIMKQAAQVGVTNA